MNPDQLLALAENDQRSDDDIAQTMGTQTMMQLGKQFSSTIEHQRAFTGWYDAVMLPLGIRREDAQHLFDGEVDVPAFVATLSPNQRERILTSFGALQSAYEHRLATRA